MLDILFPYVPLPDDERKLLKKIHPEPSSADANIITPLLAPSTNPSFNEYARQTSRSLTLKARNALNRLLPDEPSQGLDELAAEKEDEPQVSSVHSSPRSTSRSGYGSTPHFSAQGTPESTVSDDGVLDLRRPSRHGIITTANLLGIFINGWKNCSTLHSSEGS